MRYNANQHWILGYNTKFENIKDGGIKNKNIFYKDALKVSLNGISLCSFELDKINCAAVIPIW